MRDFKGWISDEVLENVNLFKDSFSSSRPFNFCSIDSFLREDIAEKILKNLLSLKDEYYLEENDLYCFYRTRDFKFVKNDFLNEARDFFMSDFFLDFMSRVTGSNILKNVGDLHSLKMSKTNYLLCHDDNVEGRKIAFILNLSKNWEDSDGGHLQLFSKGHDGFPNRVSKKILPAFNQFNFFEVSESSFHSIAEVLSEKDRITFAGWFYGR